MVAKPAGNKVRLYARVSTEEQATEGLSIETQLKQLHAHARSQKWEITGEDIDPGFSGATEDRPGLRALRNGARRREFDIVAVSRLDRFFRNLRFLLNYLHEFEELGIKFISTQEGLDTSSPFGKSAVQIMGVIAEFERDRIAERIRDCRRYRLDQGLWTSGRTPYGYRWLPREQRWEVVADEARVVQYIYHLYLDEKLGTMQIPARLNAENYHTRSGGIWHFSNVLNMLGDPVYKGRHRTGIGMPVIVTETIWEKAQRRRLQARQVRGESRNWLLQGLCVCGLCGHRYKCHQNSRTKLRYYVCRGHLKEYHPDGSHVCPSRWENATNLEFLVWNKVKAAFNDPVTLNKYVRNALAELEEKNERIGKDVLGIEQELATIKRRKEKLGIALGDEAISEEKYREQLGKLEKQEMSLKQRRHNLDPDELAEVTELSGKIAAVYSGEIGH
jgi:site-specific DNA recombinase